MENKQILEQVLTGQHLSDQELEQAKQLLKRMLKTLETRIN